MSIGRRELGISVAGLSTLLLAACFGDSTPHSIEAATDAVEGEWEVPGLTYAALVSPEHQLEYFRAVDADIQAMLDKIDALQAELEKNPEFANGEKLDIESLQYYEDRLRHLKGATESILRNPDDFTLVEKNSLDQFRQRLIDVQNDVASAAGRIG